MVPTDHRLRIKECKNIHTLGTCHRNRKAANHEGDCDTKCNCRTWNNPKELGRKTAEIRNEMPSRPLYCCDRPEY